MRERGDAPRNEWTFALGVLAACIAAFGLTLRFTSSTSSAAADLSNTPPSPLELRALAQQATLRIATNACGVLTIGSGFVVDDTLLTNAHLVEHAVEVKADQPIEPVIVPMLAVSSTTDLAAAVAPPAIAVTLASAEPEPGDSVILAGHADGGAIEVQDGGVVGLVPGDVYGFDGRVLLIEAETRGGYSGGPVFDLDGFVVGMLSGFDRSTGLTLAVPSTEIASFLVDIGTDPAQIEGGSRAAPFSSSAPCPIG